MATSDHNIEYPEELQSLLEEILGSRNVYFQPPSDKRLSYPCIIYRLDYVNLINADSIPFIKNKRYLVTHIDKVPDQYIPDKLLSLPTASFDRAYVADNLHHTAIRLYFYSKPNNLPNNSDEEE